MDLHHLSSTELEQRATFYSVWVIPFFLHIYIIIYLCIYHLILSLFFLDSRSARNAELSLYGI